MTLERDHDRTYEVTEARRATDQVDPRGRGPGMWAFAIHRLTGLALVAYLFLHLAVLAILARGPAGWDAFVAVVRTPIFLLLDVVLIAGLLVHGLNGIRVALAGLGLGMRHQGAVFGALMAVALGALALAAWRIFGG